MAHRCRSGSVHAARRQRVDAAHVTKKVKDPVHRGGRALVRLDERHELLGPGAPDPWHSRLPACGADLVNWVRACAAVETPRSTAAFGYTSTIAVTPRGMLGIRPPGE